MNTIFTKKNLLILLWMMGIASPSIAQSEPIGPMNPIRFEAFMHRVGHHNLAYQAELITLDMALAEEESAKIFQDPNLSFGATDNGQKRNKMGYEFESALEWTLELGGKRKARIQVASSQVELTRILLAQYFHTLRVDATLLFLEGIKNKHILKVKNNSYESMKKLAHADSIRFQLGEITAIDASQSQIEATLLLNERIQQQADWESSVLEINRLMGHHRGDSIYQPEDQVLKIEQIYRLEELLTLAQEHRAELKAAMQNKRVSQELVRLVKAERSLDVGLSIGAGHHTLVANSEAYTPAITSIQAGIAIPLKFSNRNKGALKAAQHALAQSELHYQDEKMEINSQVNQVFSQFQASKKQLDQFDSDLLESAKRILEGQVYRYQRGESSLLEVLHAQKTYNEIQEGYHETLFAYHVTLIKLQYVVGIWDVIIT